MREEPFHCPAWVTAAQEALRDRRFVLIMRYPEPAREWVTHISVSTAESAEAAIPAPGDYAILDTHLGGALVKFIHATPGGLKKEVLFP